MIGIDLVSIKRVEIIIKKYDKIFLSKFLNNNEIDLVTMVKNNKKFNINRIAGFFAAKEAISKALGCGIGKELKFHDMEIIKDMYNAPKVKLNTEVKQRFNITNINISISHDKDYAIAIAILN